MKLITILCLALLSVSAGATHLRGGYIQVKPVLGLTYTVTVTMYFDEVGGKEASAAAKSLTVCFGDGSTESAIRQSQAFISDKSISINTYQIAHAYAGPGTYTIETSIQSRSFSRNTTRPADQMPFALTTTFSTNTSGANQTPTLRLPDRGFMAAVNQRLILPLTMTDADGDSLVYNLARPLTSAADKVCEPQPVTTYVYPNDVARRGTYKLNSRTGDLTWDAPLEEGNYSIALTVNEYRRGTLISQTAVEISLIVVDQPGTPTPIPPYEPASDGQVVTGLTEYRDEDVILNVFPNPVDDRLQVVVQTTKATTAVIQLLDVNGRTLHELAFKRVARQHEQVIGMDSLTPGVYVLRAEVDGRSLVRKVMKR